MPRDFVFRICMRAASSSETFFSPRKRPVTISCVLTKVEYFLVHCLCRVVFPEQSSRIAFLERARSELVVSSFYSRQQHAYFISAV